MKQWLVLMIFSSLVAAQPSGILEFPINEKIAASIPLQQDASEMIQLSLEPGSSELTIQTDLHKQTLPIPYLQDDHITVAPLLVADFNFDGFTDLALPETEGYGGVNYFYSLYIYSAEGFEFLPLPELEWACNPYLDTETKTLKISCKSGPFYYLYHYRFENGKPYLAFDTKIIYMDAINTEDVFLLETRYDSSGKKITSSISSYSGDKATGTIAQDNVSLFSEPSEASRSEAYLIKGNMVEVLALSDDEAWVNIAYQNEHGERKTAWIKPLELSVY